MAFETVDIPCMVTALFFFFSNLLRVILRSKQYSVQKGSNSTFDYETFLQLDPEFLSGEWQERANYRGLTTITGLFNAIAWFLLCIPILQLTWVLSRAGKRKIGLHTAIVVFVVGGSLAELISRLMTVGMYNVSLYLASDFNLNNWVGENTNDGIGWRVLEVTWMISNGMLLWIDAFEWLALYGVLLLIFISVRSEKLEDPTFSKQWATFGLCIGVLCLFDFLSDIMRFESWRTFMIIALSISSLNQLVFLPAWLLWLGMQLKTAKAPYDTYDAGMELPVNAIGTAEDEVL